MKLQPTDVQRLIYGEGAVRRFTQDSPVLPDVWAQFAAFPDKPVDLLLTPFQHSRSVSITPGEVQKVLEDRMAAARKAKATGYHRHSDDQHRVVAANQTTVAVWLYFDELVRVVLPMSFWWTRECRPRKGTGLWTPKTAVSALRDKKTRQGMANRLAHNADSELKVSREFLWLIKVVGAIALVNRAAKAPPDIDTPPWRWDRQPGDEKAYRKKLETYYQAVLDSLHLVTTGMDAAPLDDPLVYMVSQNRKATTALFTSVPATKADAARRLFEIDGSGITWAVIDSGIDARHPAFRRFETLRSGKVQPCRLPGPRSREQNWTDKTRVTATYDFNIIRHILSKNPHEDPNVPPQVKAKLTRDPRRAKSLRESLQSGREIDWSLVMPLVEVKHDQTYQPPSQAMDHGTHVAGILGADWRDPKNADLEDGVMRGVCPDINLIDIRVFNEQDGEGGEFNVMAALQLLRYLNSHKEFMVVHGVNLSMSIKHEVANYACGRTPICEECRRCIGEGLIVVVAAGNEGYVTELDTFQGYRDVTITDPGNTEEVITVGSTHRDMPHTYGVSYFSSRGPTGDGRIKPDLVAPGEKIDSTVPGGLIMRKEGTSMSAPHVSGAAALLIAKHHELIGQPQRVKQLLCDSATDLGREKYFQGAGMLDVLRALQSH